MNRLSSREKVLVSIVVGAVFVLGNFLALSSLWEGYGRTKASLANKQRELAALKQVFSQRDVLAKQEAWVKQKQPKLVNRDQAGVALLDEIKAVAKAHEVMLDNQQFGESIDAQPSYQSVWLMVQTKSTWPNLIAFLNGLQQPDKFIVFEGANLQIDSADPTQMRGKFRIAKWYAP